MDLISYHLLGKVYWPIDLLIWAVFLLILHGPCLRYYSDKEINRFWNFIYFSMLLIIFALCVIAWFWVVFDSIRLIHESSLVQRGILVLFLLLLVFVFFEDFIKKIFAGVVEIIALIFLLFLLAFDSCGDFIKKIFTPKMV